MRPRGISSDQRRENVMFLVKRKVFDGIAFLGQQVLQFAHILLGSQVCSRFLISLQQNLNYFLIVALVPQFGYHGSVVDKLFNIRISAWRL